MSEKGPADGKIAEDFSDLAYREAIRKRQYDEALEILEADLKSKGMNADLELLSRAAELSRRYFDHKMTMHARALGRKYNILPPSIDELVAASKFDVNCLDAAHRLSLASGFKLEVPEARDNSTAMHQAIKYYYNVSMAKKNDAWAYEYARIGGLLNRDEYRKLFELALDNNVLYRAHNYALEGKLYDASKKEIKTWLDELDDTKEKIRQTKLDMQDKRTREGLSLRELMDKYGGELKSLEKQTKALQELLLASVE